MIRFDRRTIIIITGMGAILAGIAFLATPNDHDNSIARNILLYLVATPTGETQVWQLNWETRHAERVAQLPGMVIEYAKIPQTARIAYPVERPDGGHDLWLLDVGQRHVRRWLDCTPDDCRAVAPSPNGLGAVYTRVADDDPTLWWIGYHAAKTTRLFTEPPLPGDYAAWSPDGTRLAYADPTRGVCIVDFSDASDIRRISAPRCIPAMTESSPVWSPDGATLLVVDMQSGPGFFTSHILRVDVTSGEWMDLRRDVKSYVSKVEDDAPAWSPDGMWIAFRRKAANTAMGKQVWVMRADGSDAHALTADTASYHGPPIWADDGVTLLTTRYTAETSGIWAISRVSDTASLVVSGGYLPH